MKKYKSLFLFTSEYPCGGSEVFVENELRAWSDDLEVVHLFPSFAGTVVNQWVPEKALVHPYRPISLSWSERYRVLLLFFEIALQEIMVSGLFVLLKYGRQNWGSLKSAAQRAAFIESEIRDKDIPTSLFYSFWMNEWALALAILKRRQSIPDFVFRVHGYDLYDELRPDSYIPFRYFIMKHCRKVVPVCEAASRYLRAKRIYPEKVGLARLGVFDHGENPFQSSAVFTVVSCSSLNRNKRVELIPVILKELGFPVRWVHFGGKGNYTLDEFRGLCSRLPSSVEVELRGQVSNSELLDFYQTNPVNLFMHFSASEGGVPVVLQEAGSFGIPMIATDAGGTSEIVRIGTGILLSLVFDPEAAAEQIRRFRNSAMNTPEFRKGVRKYTLQNFDAGKNLRHFLSEIS